MNTEVLEIPLRDEVKNSEYGVPCGTCQWLGIEPNLINGVCEYCNRTEAEIIRHHGTVKLTPEEVEQREKAGIVHMMGGRIVYT